VVLASPRKRVCRCATRLGESLDDLADFDGREFVRALFAPD
jgi:hypothetical protein